MWAARRPALKWNDNNAAVTVDSGTMGSMMQTLNTTLPSYVSQLDTLAGTLATTVNTQHATGFDSTGASGVDFFTSTDGQPVNAGNLAVAISDPKQIATSSVSGALDGKNADALGDLGDLGGSAEATYRALVVKLGNDTQAAQRRADVQSPVTDNADSAVQASSGINLDEEMTNLMAYQRGYQAASRVINTIDSCLDTLINHTGS